MNCLDHYQLKDFTCEFARPTAYLRTIIEHLSLTRNFNSDGSLTLQDFEATAWHGMLVEALTFIEEVEGELYPEKGTKAA